MDLPGTLRETLAETHRRIEQLPYAEAIMKGTIGRGAYVASLWQFLAVHEALESALAAHPGLPCHDAATMSRSRSLRADLAAWGASSPEAARPEAARLAATFAGWSGSSPWALLGALYVFEGSRMGSMFLCKSLSKALEVPPGMGNGLDYHAEGVATRPMDWAAFRDALRDAPLGEAEQRDVVEAARETFDALYDLYATLDVEDSALIPLELAL